MWLQCLCKALQISGGPAVGCGFWFIMASIMMISGDTSRITRLHFWAMPIIYTSFVVIAMLWYRLTVKEWMKR